MQKQTPVQMLTLSDGLQESALNLVLDEGAVGIFGHDDSKGRSASKRIASYGKSFF